MLGRSTAVVPLARNRVRRAAAMCGAALLVFVGIGWSYYAATTVRGDPGPSYAPDYAAAIGRVMFVALGLLGLRVLLLRSCIVVGPQALAVLEPLRFSGPVVLARDAVKRVRYGDFSVTRANRFSSGGWVGDRLDDPPVVGDPGTTPTVEVDLGASRRFMEARRLPLGGTNRFDRRPLHHGGDADRIFLSVPDVDAAREALAGWGDGDDATPPRAVAIGLPERTPLTSRFAVGLCCALVEVTFWVHAGALAWLPIVALAAAFRSDARRYRRELETAVAAYAPPPDAARREERLMLNLHGH